MASPQLSFKYTLQNEFSFSFTFFTKPDSGLDRTKEYWKEDNNFQ